MDARPGQLRPQMRVGEQGMDGLEMCLDVIRRDQEGCVTGDLRQRRRVAPDDRRAAGHGLDDREAETLVPGGKPDQRSCGVESTQSLVFNKAQQPNLRSTSTGTRRVGRIRVVHEDQFELREESLEARDGGEDQIGVLAEVQTSRD